MPVGTRRTETQNTDDNETGLAVAPTITYSPRPDKIGVRIEGLPKNVSSNTDI